MAVTSLPPVVELAGDLTRRTAPEAGGLLAEPVLGPGRQVAVGLAPEVRWVEQPPATRTMRKIRLPRARNGLDATNSSAGGRI
ncbi:hypothetical protein [Streptomyces sp. NBC_01176]|uniref:hypothetical protein n=1 Tax=Streptomyces sp. NBC_01176 TaxID=2903760 RepID=UPI003866F24E|nr:hypothetical protein OG199_41855 [Streptomyces sp. NBC_01176]